MVNLFSVTECGEYRDEQREKAEAFVGLARNEVRDLTDDEREILAEILPGVEQ